MNRENSNKKVLRIEILNIINKDNIRSWINQYLYR